jgi:hypothetical protein
MIIEIDKSKLVKKYDALSQASGIDIRVMIE